MSKKNKKASELPPEQYSVSYREPERKQIEKRIKNFLKQGGGIEVIQIGVTNADFQKRIRA